MGRIARVVVPGRAHHVTQRGNRRMPTFFGPEDYRAHRPGNAGRDLAGTMRRHEATGRPLGDRAFVQSLSALLGRDLLPKKPGPKPKEAS